MTLTLAQAIAIAITGFLAGGIAIGCLALHLARRRRWHQRYRAQRYEEVL